MPNTFFNISPTDDPNPDTIRAASGTSPNENGMTSIPVRTTYAFTSPLNPRLARQSLVANRAQIRTGPERVQNHESVCHTNVQINYILGPLWYGAVVIPLTVRP